MIVYFSGTGNSRFVAKKLAELTGDELCDATRFTRESKGADFSRPGSYVFVSPVYVSAPPRAFMDFIRKSRFPNNVRAYFVMTCAGGMGGSPEYCRRTHMAPCRIRLFVPSLRGSPRRPGTEYTFRP